MCNAAHGVQELRVNEARQTGWLAPDFKTRFCDQWSAGDCPDGGACTISVKFTDAEPVHDANTTASLTSTRPVLCAEYCTRVHDISELRRETAVSLGVLPENYKFEVCSYHACGTCKRGDTCHFAHGVADLR